VEVAALEVALTVPMVNMNIQILAVNAHIADPVLTVVVRIAHLANINMSQDKVNVAIADPVLMVVDHIVHQENMNIEKMGKVASQLNRNNFLILNYKGCG
jgi:hypothetical protein